MRIQSSSLKRHWGLSFFCLASLASLIKVLSISQSGHFDIFRDAALKIWSGQIPYGIEYPFGFFLYSPSCALFFYGAFAWMPYAMGLGFYLGVSWMVFFVGARTLGACLPLSDRSRNLFWFMVSSEMIGTLLNARLEIFIIGIVMLAGAWIAQRKIIFWAYFLLAMICNFKMMELPTVGLLLLVSVLGRKSYREIFYFLSGLIFWYALPFAVKPIDFIQQNMNTWNASLIPFMKSTWPDFQHFYRFLSTTFGIHFTFIGAQITGAVCGLFFAAFLAWRMLKIPFDPKLDTFRALALGAAFILPFSPMSQSAGYILYAPLLLTSLYFAQISLGVSQRSWTVLIAISWFCISIAYSDLTPKPLREIFFDHALKAFGVFLLSVPHLFAGVSEPSANRSEKAF